MTALYITAWALLSTYVLLRLFSKPIVRLIWWYFDRKYAPATTEYTFSTHSAPEETVTLNKTGEDVTYGDYFKATASVQQHLFNLEMQIKKHEEERRLKKKFLGTWKDRNKPYKEDKE